MEPICAISTPAGGALGMIRVSGDDAIGIVNHIFSKDISSTPGYTAVHGSVGIDDVVIIVYRSPHSFTGEDSVEIMCHGPAYIMQKTVEMLCQQGCRLAHPGEYTQRAFLNGKMDLSQAEAVADLIASTSAATHRLAMSQMRGGFSKELRSLREQLLEIKSLLELEIDFSEEDVEFADREKLLTLLTDTKQKIHTLLTSFRAGNALRNGIPVVIAGETNVGKSTLLNRLLNEDRAIVSDVKGTTRDTIEECITIGDYRFRFIDTAGLRITNDMVEQMGIERSRKKIREAQIILMMTEPGVPYPDVKVTEEQIVIHIENKTPQFQALTGIGVDALKERLVKEAESLCHCDSDIVVTNLRHVEALRKASQSVEQALSSLTSHLSSDIIALDLNDCITHLSEITGDITSDEVLRNIFSHFCIGK